MEKNIETMERREKKDTEKCREIGQTTWDKWKEDTLRKFNRTA